jgi:hypothetical protein
MNLQPEVNRDENLDPNRPGYLIKNSQLPDTWIIDLETIVDQRFYVQISTPQTKAFSVETTNFVSESDSLAYLNQQNHNIRTNGLIYVFFESKFDLSVVDDGYVWEVKSPCCYSRGVTFSIDTIYIHIFGSEDSTWDDIGRIYTEQISDIYSYLGMDLPPGFLPDTATNQLDAPLITTSLLILTFAIRTIMRRQKEVRV